MAKVKKAAKKAAFGDILKTISPIGGAVAGLFSKKKQAPMQPPAEGTMKKGGKMKKAQKGISAPKKKPVVDSVRSEMFPDKMIPRSKSNYFNGSFDKTANALNPAKAKVKKKMKSGGSFPDLNKDGKVTKKDVLIGRGVLPKTAKKGKVIEKSMKMGGKAAKQAAIAISMKKAGKTPKAMMKMGGKTKKCAYGCK